VNVSPLCRELHEQREIRLNQFFAFVGEAVDVVKVFRLALHSTLEIKVMVNDLAGELGY
jgi:hypothetical protein